jgi:hypothetical protein
VWFDFLHKCCLKTFLIIRRIQRDIIITAHRASCTVPFFLPALMKLEFSRQNFEQFSNIRFYENPSSGSRVASCGQSDRRTDLTRLTVAFRSVANAQTTISTRQSLPLTEFEKSLSCSSLYRILNQLNVAYKFIHHSLKISLILSFFLNQGPPSGRILLGFQTVIFRFISSLIVLPVPATCTAWCNHSILFADDFKLCTSFTTNWYYCRDRNIGGFRL